MSTHKPAEQKRPVLGLLYLDHVLRFFDHSNFKGWPDRIETVVYHWGNDQQRFINEVRRKNIDVLIGNIPATAYETFRDIARALPHVQFIPSLDTQFANKSKENVTHFCEKYELPIPKTHIFYEKEEAARYLQSTAYPRIIKRSYGPSNYGGYYVHKVDNEAEALELLAEKRYYPVYVQDFVPMKADIRVMLIGHKPVCAFWRRPPKGEWLTNTSQGGSMDYMQVPKVALDVAVQASKAANAEYWACDIAVSHDDHYSILECATAFAAFPYIRDWIGQYLMWKLSDGKLPCPNIPMYNWEELGKISSSVLRTLRHIHFGTSPDMQPMTDTGETFHHQDSDGYPILDTLNRQKEEWPSEQWNRQDNYQPLDTRHSIQVITHDDRTVEDTGIEDLLAPTECSLSESEEVPGDISPVAEKTSVTEKTSTVRELMAMSEPRMIELLASARGVSQKLAIQILAHFGLNGVVDALENNPQRLTEVKNIKARKLAHILQCWERHLQLV